MKERRKKKKEKKNILISVLGFNYYFIVDLITI